MQRLCPSTSAVNMSCLLQKCIHGCKPGYDIYKMKRKSNTLWDTICDKTTIVMRSISWLWDITYVARAQTLQVTLQQNKNVPQATISIYWKRSWTKAVSIIVAICHNNEWLLFAIVRPLQGWLDVKPHACNQPHACLWWTVQACTCCVWGWELILHHIF